MCMEETSNYFICLSIHFSNFVEQLDWWESSIWLLIIEFELEICTIYERFDIGLTACRKGLSNHSWSLPQQLIPS